MADKNETHTNVPPSPEELDKLRAQAERERAETEARKRESEANARKLNAEAEEIDIDRDKAKVELEVAAMDLRRKQRDEAEEHAKNKYHFTYHFTGAVGESSVRDCINQIDIWRRTNEKPIETNIIFTSPGGSILDGLVLYDYLKMLQREGHKVTTGTYGMAASMAGILLQAGDKRWVGREAWVLIHEAGFGAMGKTSEVEDTVEWIKRIQKRIVSIFAERAAKTEGSKKRSVTQLSKEIEKNWKRKDWWLSSEECLEWGFCDEVR